MSLHPEDTYPAFDLVDQSGERTSSASVAGSWFLLYWYRKADTPGCTAHAADATHAKRVAHLVRPDGTVAVAYDVDDPEFFAERVLDDLELLGTDGTG